jgi:hypothetical protein
LALPYQHDQDQGITVPIVQEFFPSSGEYKKDELLEASRSGNEEKMMTLLTPLNVNSHASDGRKVRRKDPRSPEILANLVFTPFGQCWMLM